MNALENTVRQGVAQPDEFAREVWPVWARGETPLAEHVSGMPCLERHG